MCRICLYKGKEILLGDLLIKPENSLLRQSRDASFHPGVVDKGDVRNIRVNGDGFGVAFYGKETSSSRASCVFKFVTPAWSNVNLRNLGKFINANLIVGHVRAASSGHTLEETVVSFENCHPFHHDVWTFCHNGGISKFNRIKKRLINLMDEESFLGISGSTDSEYIFALFLSLLPKVKPGCNVSLSAFRSTVLLTMKLLLEICAEEGLQEGYSLNLVFTDGINVIATRFRNGTEGEAPSLYYLQGSDFDCTTGLFRNTADKDTSEILISSAPLHKSHDIAPNCSVHGPSCRSPGSPKTDVIPLSHEDLGEDSYWALIPNNHMLLCRGDQCDVSKVVGVDIEPIVLPELTSTHKERLLSSHRSPSLTSIGEQIIRNSAEWERGKDKDTIDLKKDQAMPATGMNVKDTCQLRDGLVHHSSLSTVPTSSMAVLFIALMVILVGKKE